MVSSGRDAAVYLTDLRATDKHTLVCRETSPVLRMVMTPDQAGLWVATSESSIKHWPLNNRLLNGSGGGNGHCASTTTEENKAELEPLVQVSVVFCYDSKVLIYLLLISWFDEKNSSFMAQEPDSVIRGGPSIRSYTILNDKRQIVTRDTEGGVQVYDVLKAAKLADLGVVEVDQVVEERQQTVFVPNWFTVDLKTGMLTIHLGQDENDCLSAWVSARETGLAPNETLEQKVDIVRWLPCHR